jgi:hypothetical protein
MFQVSLFRLGRWGLAETLARPLLETVTEMKKIQAAARELHSTPTFEIASLAEWDICLDRERNWK